ncbi:drebrin-like protein A isoform X1 [Oryzias melastigma]|uniref:drebrin-like protein A isoform X1 n=1 Tax=Oryzias melastigma TaxID=30732 RepID=UPI000CF7CF3E|nr:drebrin-like protein A isoform X1 [Oryzias melastigma]
MSKQRVNLDTYSLSLLTAKEDILNPRSSTNWALFVYEGATNKLKLADSGVGGVTELAEKFHISKPQYGLCNVGQTESGAAQIAMICWMGQKVDDYWRTECSSHIPAIKNFFKEAQAFISAEKADDVTEEKIRAELSKAQAQPPSQWVRRSSRSSEKEDIVGTNYRKTNAAMEMRLINRDSFWAHAEREEEERKEEERRKAAEERRRLERERVLKERREEEERDRKMNEKLQMIEEQRRKQEEQEEEMRRKEKLKWEQLQREHQEDMRARLRRSESIEKAAEAAVLVSQRSMNPREFFRQLSSSSSQSPTSPGSSRTGKPFRRYQRSLTDTAFIFSKAEESAPSSPRSSPLVSPFSRAPPSPLFHATSAPRSPDFCSASSPQMPKAPMSPPLSPLRPPPPVSALPSVSQTSNQVINEPKAPSPTEPPDSLRFLGSSSPSFIEKSPDTPPATPPNVPDQTESAGPPPEISQLSTADRSTESDVHNGLLSDIAYTVQAVLVEENEEEDTEEHEQHKTDEQPDLCETMPEHAQIETKETEEEQVNEEHLKEEEVDEEEEEVDGLKEPALLEEIPEVGYDEDEAEEDVKEYIQLRDSQPLAEPVETEESSVPDTKYICQDKNHDALILPTNGITNGQEQNGTERSLSPSDTEHSTSELSVSCHPHADEEEDFTEDKDEGISENGQEDSVEQHMCVRALYDYQAEDETEISFEPGDIIRDVETVDKAWWRGWSKDGRQGLFPANYVETI